METLGTQSTSWHSRISSTTSKAVTGTVNGIGSAVSKTVDAWVHTPKAIKLPLETAAFLYAPESWVGTKGSYAIAAATVLTETPKNLAAFLTNSPVQYIGERWQLISSSFPSDPKLPLNDLDKKICTFERAQPPIVNPTQLDLAIQPPSSETRSSTASVNNMTKVTDRKLDVLVEKISYFSSLKVIHFFSGVSESPTAPLLSLVDEASRTNNPSLWGIFTKHYGSKMSLWGRFKAGFMYMILCRVIPIIPKTVDAYFKNILSELRINLKENGEKRKKFINGLLDDMDNFFEVYNGAAETYAKDKARKGNLNHYRKNAIDLMLPREELNTEKTPEELKMDLYHKLSASIVDHFSPKIRFGILENWLNSKIKALLRDQVLPQVFLSISDEGQEATKRHNIPFFLALTKTLTALVSKIQGKLDESSSDSSSLYGIKNFEGIVKKFLWTIDMADCKTADEVRAKINALAEPETGIDADVRNGIQLGVQKGLAVFFDYLSKQENTEDLFANLFESLQSPFSGHLPMTDKQWAEMAIEYEGAKILLKQAGSSLSKQIVQTAVQDKVRGGNSPEATQRVAQSIFSKHKIRAQETLEELLRVCDTVQEKIQQAKDFCADETSIHSDLASIASILKAYENEERVKITMEQDPPPQIATLPSAEQEAILRVLYPVYEGSDQMMDLVLKLQSLQKQHTSSTKITRELRQIREAIEEIVSNPSIPTALEQINRMKNHFDILETLDPAASDNLRELKELIDAINRSLQQLSKEQKELNALARLQPFPGTKPGAQQGLIDQLVLSVLDKPLPGFKKWRCMEQIKQNVKIAAFSAVDQQRIFELVEKMSKFNTLPNPRPDFNREIWEPLSALLNERKSTLDRSQKKAVSLVERSIPRAHQRSSLEETSMHELSQSLWKEMRETGDLLQSNASNLSNLLEQAQKEILLQPTAAQLGQVGGTLGFVLGLAAGKSMAPEVGSAFGAVAAASVANLKTLAQGKWVRFSIPVVGAGAAATIATKFFTKALDDLFWPDVSNPMPEMIPILIGAAGASAGLEYVGAKMTKRLIDTGVDIAMPKVTKVFDAAYEELLMNDIVINGTIKIMMKQIVDLFPPKKSDSK